ncbi:MAG TPA: 6-phosphofructo-2-kinase/fructose-2,6-bisphosphatase [Polyangiaceae bacterium]|jgi:broad specificity phosphatase PhoE/predicted kinase|nr:6-phosphofructo-2-kinase/fructose-2,6-bisphosphatase [Polyangiaceae bacterium]
MQAPERKSAFVMVGLPARGKSFIARKIARYLSWLGFPTRVFNVGSYRREHLGDYAGHRFFDPDNAEGVAARQRLASMALNDMLAWLGAEGRVAIFDATNTTRARRKWVADQCKEAGVDVTFIEIIGDDPETVDANIRATKLRSPDYAGMSEERQVVDFRARIAHYERMYEPIDEEHLSYVKLIDGGRQVIVNRMEGYIPARVVAYLMNLRPTQRTIWLTRHGESVSNVLGRIGGDAELSERGSDFAKRLAEHFRSRRDIERLVVWTSSLQRTILTSEPLGAPAIAWRALDEIDAGVCDGMTYEEIRERLPAEFAARQADKLRYRYPGGESYEDIVQRLDPLIAELERRPEPLLVIAHQAVLRALYCYLIGETVQRCPFLEIPLHTLIELTPTAYGCDERRVPLLTISRA